MVGEEIQWWRIVVTIRERIAVGDLKPGRRIPTEEQLGDEFGVSRTTVRRAMLEL